MRVRLRLRVRVRVLVRASVRVRGRVRVVTLRGNPNPVILTLTCCCESCWSLAWREAMDLMAAIRSHRLRALTWLGRKSYRVRLGVTVRIGSHRSRALMERFHPRWNGSNPDGTVRFLDWTVQFLLFSSLD